MREVDLCINCGVGEAIEDQGPSIPPEERENKLYCAFCMEFGVNRPQSTRFEQAMAKHMHRMMRGLFTNVG
jgi:hypothetical protein